MPVHYRCKKCGKELFTFKHVGQDYFGLPTYDFFKEYLGGTCPKCGSEIKKPKPEDILLGD